ncbi:Receptor protein-tyrosine kinase cepr1 [Asimina triloba]
MALLPIIIFHLLSFLSLFNPSLQSQLQDQSQFFALMKASITGKPVSQWNSTPPNAYCNNTGVACSTDGYVTELDLSGSTISGQLPPHLFSYLPKLRVLRLGDTGLRGRFPSAVLNCSSLEELNLSTLHLAGTLPDLSPLKSLRVLDISYNEFHGEFPMSLFNLTDIEVLYSIDSGKFAKWQLPDDIDRRLTKVESLILASCNIHGSIPPSIGNMTSLFDLELTENSLVGPIPREIGKLGNLHLLELYFNQLAGDIPHEIGNLTQLTDMDMSVNQLTGTIPESICRLPRLQCLQLYNNSLVGEIPPVLGNSTTLNLLSLYQNFLTGPVPPNLGQFSEFVGVDLSENQLSGGLPAEICKGGKLGYFLMLDNQFSGYLPENLAKCDSLVRFRVSSNRLEGPIPDGLLGLRHVSIIDLGFNRFDGSLPKSIGKAGNLSELYVQNNQISGFLPTEISQVDTLVKIDLSNNLLSGTIPSDIGNLRKMNLLSLQGNRLTSSIPESLSSLKSLNVLNLSNNLLTGKIPESLCQLLPNSLDFSNNRLSGPVPVPLLKEGLVESYMGNPGLCLPFHEDLAGGSNLPLCRGSPSRKKMGSIWAIVISTAVIVLGLLLYVRRRCRRDRAVVEQDTMSSSSSYDVLSFHKLSFRHHEIVDALIEKNVVGYGGSGTVYKIELSDGHAVAVKKLWTRKTKSLSSEQAFQDRELRTEVETLGNIRHKNIVKLYCCFSNPDSNLLVYEYMPNGNLWDALHKGKGLLDWPTRHRIAIGIAQGLAYLHHDLLPPIIHRDIKSTNILLDEEFQPKVADFGVAKVLQDRGGKDSTTVFAGTCGYLAPEYACSSKATIKCDVYSFGVVLMELISGKKPVEAEFGENMNIVYWVCQKVATREGVAEVLDKRLSGMFKDEMIRVLRLAIRCTCASPALRPTMKEAVQLLIESDPGRFNDFKSWDKLKDSATDAKPV